MLVSAFIVYNLYIYTYNIITDLSLPFTSLKSCYQMKRKPVYEFHIFFMKDITHPERSLRRGGG